MGSTRMLFLGVLSLAVGGHTLPQFEAYWESQYSYLYNEDESHNPWYIDLGDIDAGPPGYLEGPSIVTIGFADICTDKCQESYPDEFCSKYPPEGIPARPRTVEDWGTKFNITSNILTKGIAALKAKGTKINLSYGTDGLGPKGGGGDNEAAEDISQARLLAERMAKNVADWDLDGVDIFTTGKYQAITWPGQSVGFHHQVFKSLRSLLPPEKTISYTIMHHSDRDTWHPMDAVIAVAHKYMDYINLQFIPEKEDSILGLLTNDFGVPASKIGWMLNYWWHGDQYMEEMQYQMGYAVNSIKQKGLRGLSFVSVNQEHNYYRGEFLKEIAETLYA